MSTVDSANEIFDNVISFIEYTNQSIFLTGKAGTGKTTLLRKIKETTAKKTVIVAPTGVAAMNAKGVTINSLFQLPPGSFFPGDVNLASLRAGVVSIKSLLTEINYSKERKTLLMELELMIIDEVSMVRCDVIDAVDAILRMVRKNDAPFGGVQLLLIGDLFQLPPVTKREDWELLSKIYPSPYFFEATVVKQNPLLQVELKQVFRQTEPEFVDILNDIRNNQIGEERLAILNQRFDPLFKQAEGSNHIIITSHNAEANTINNEKADELEGEDFVFEGQVEGTFSPQVLPVEQSLRLKIGAQVMFIKNDTGDDRKFYNGKIGKVKSILGEEIYISFPDEEEDLLLERSSWQSFEYKANENNAIVQQQVGEFFQFPIKLAWAVTIHKSQGLTFDSAIIDAGNSFVSGQVYVALSRVRTLNGLILRSKINKESLRSNIEVLNYMKLGNVDSLTDFLAAAQERYIIHLFSSTFSFNELTDSFEKLSADHEVMKSTDPEFRSMIGNLSRSIEALQGVSIKFQSQLRQLQKEHGLKDPMSIHTRMDAAYNYFAKELTLQVINLLNKHIRTKPKNKSDQKLVALFTQHRLVADHKIFKIRAATEIAGKAANWENQHELMKKIQELLKKKMNSPGAAQNATTMQLF
ncbi:ATP-dependent DNA helicase [Pedobacter gandavensis]|uniref:AAA family ATPase n=1 Tax=Pedobacter gandavensis TaxID=2679963 RepID=A0ABR6EZ80_9SPHI|nr:AAA family ATPase [Pedobacter gandavensis]MBB2150588.1 AAA family ATPase [Pedobacter gandavensis]